MFPDVSTALRMFMCLMVSNCSVERSFSRMAFMKNKLRSTMTDERLSALELLSVESDMLHQISFPTLLKNFLMQRAESASDPCADHKQRLGVGHDFLHAVVGPGLSKNVTKPTMQ